MKSILKRTLSAFLAALMVFFFLQEPCVTAFAAESAPEASESAVEGESLSDQETEAETELGTDPDVDENYGISFDDDDLFSVPVNDGSDPDVDSFGNEYGPAEGVTWGAVDPDEETTAVVDAAFAYPDPEESYEDNFDPETGTYTDLEMSDSDIYTRYEESLEYFPLSNVEQDIAPQSVTVLVLNVFAGIVLTLGYKIASDAISSVFKKFLTLCRQKFGDNEKYMSALNDFTALKAGAVFQLGVIKTMLKAVWSDLFNSDNSFTTDSKENVIKDPINSVINNYVSDYNPTYEYLGNSVSLSGCYYGLDILFPIGSNPICFYVDSGSSYNYYLNAYYYDTDGNLQYGHLYSYYTFLSADGNTYNHDLYYCSPTLYSYGSSWSKCRSSNFTDSQLIELAGQLDLPLFRSSTYAAQYAKYGLMDGMILSDGTTYQSTFFQKAAAVATGEYAIAKEIADYEALNSSDDESTIVSGLTSLYSTVKVKGETALGYARYALGILSGTMGLSLSASAIDSFIKYYKTKYLNGSSAEELEDDAEDLMAKGITVVDGGGGSSGEDPDDNDYPSWKAVISNAVVAAMSAFAVANGYSDEETEPMTKEIDGHIFIEDPISSSSSGTNTGSNTNTSTGTNTGTNTGSSSSNVGSITFDDSGIISAIQNLPSSLANLFQNVSDAVGSAASSAASSVSAGVAAIPGSIGELLDNLGQGINSRLDDIYDYLSRCIPVPADFANAISDVLIGEDDQNYQLESSVIDRFPFCIPFDLVNSIQVLKAKKTDPVFTIPFVLENDALNLHYQYDIVIDLTEWEGPVQVIRFMILLLYCFGLILVTRQLIRG